MEITFRRQPSLLSAFAQQLWAGCGADLDAAIDHSEIIEVYVRSVTGTCPKFTSLRPASGGEVFGPKGGVDAAINRPVKRIAHDIPLRGRSSCRRHQKSRVPSLPSHRVGGKRKIKDRESMQEKIAVVDAGIPADVDHNFMRIKLPFGVRKFASRNAAVVHHIVIGTRLLDQLAGKGKGRGRGQNGAPSLKLKPGCSGDIVKASGFGRQIVCRMARLNVIVIGPAIESEMARGRRLACIGVVGDFIRAQDVVPVMDLAIAVQFVDCPIFLLLDGTDDRAIIKLRRSPVQTGCNGGNSFVLFLCILSFGTNCGISHRQLAGY